MHDFTLRLFKSINKMILRECDLSMMRVDKKKTNVALKSYLT